MGFDLGATLGAWMLYLAVGILIALIPSPWPPRGSVRYWLAVGIPAAMGAAQTVSTGLLSYGLAAIISAVMTKALLDKRATEHV